MPAVIVVRADRLAVGDRVRTRFGTAEPIVSVIRIPQDRVVYLLFAGHTERFHPATKLRLA